MTDSRTLEVEIVVGDARLPGTLDIPPAARALVLFAHGSGSGRASPRNVAVARGFQSGGFATLLVDLLDPKEAEADERSGHLRFNIDLLAERVAGVTAWLASAPETSRFDVGYFGASTGAAAALQAAACDGERVKAIVSRGGRPDLALPHLAKVRVPTLLIVGERDVPVIPLNREAFDALKCEKELTIVPGAGHLFEEPGTLESVERLALRWYERHLSTPVRA
jgi:putative phosphoribosyl transferase